MNAGEWKTSSEHILMMNMEGSSLERWQTNIPAPIFTVEIAWMILKRP